MTNKQAQPLSVAEAAQLLETRLDYLYHLVQAGAIAATKVDGQWRIDRRSLEAYQRSHPQLGKVRREQHQHS